MPVTAAVDIQPDRVDPATAAAYLRQLPDMNREAVHQALAELLAFAKQQGLALAAVHYEPRPSERLATWAALITGCRSEGIATVVVPSPLHFHQDAAIAAFMREELAEKIQGAVRYASEATPASTATRAGRRER